MQRRALRPWVGTSSAGTLGRARRPEPPAGPHRAPPPGLPAMPYPVRTAEPHRPASGEVSSRRRPRGGTAPWGNTVSETSILSVHAPRRRPRWRRMPTLLGLLALLLPPVVGLGAGTAHAGTSPYGRTLAVEGLADPDIYKVDDNLYFLSGTSSQNFVHLHLDRPADVQPAAPLQPERVRRPLRLLQPVGAGPGQAGRPVRAVLRGRSGGQGRALPGGQQRADDLLRDGAGHEQRHAVRHAPRDQRGHLVPRTYVPMGCPSDGCDRAMRLDPSVYSDGSRRWMHYTWFDPGAGSVVSAFPLNEPANVIEVARPSRRPNSGSTRRPPSSATTAGTTSSTPPATTGASTA